MKIFYGVSQGTLKMSGDKFLYESIKKYSKRDRIKKFLDKWGKDYLEKIIEKNDKLFKK